MAGTRDPLRRRHTYRVRPNALNARASANLPPYASRIGGFTDAYTPRQALFFSIARLGLPDREQPHRILDELCQASNPDSSFYSEGFMVDLGESEALKANLTASLVKKYIGELGSFRGSQEERRKRAEKFLLEHEVFDKVGGRIRRTVTVPRNPTKEGLEMALRRVLKRKKRKDLLNLYEHDVEGKAPEPWQRQKEPVAVQECLF